MPYCLIVLIAAVIISSCSKKNNLPSLKETFSRKDKIPFGTFVAYKELEQVFYKNTIHPRKQSFEKTWKEISDTGSLYISISRNLFLTNADKEAMLSYVEQGNSLFISSANIDQELLDTLDCSVESTIPTFAVMRSFLGYTGVQMLPGIYNDSAIYKYYYLPFNNAFSHFDSTRTKVLGLNDSGKPNCIIIFYGKGRFYLHCDPRAFSNYFLLQKDNYRYLDKIISFTPGTPELVYWDDFYNRKNYQNTNNKNALSVLLQYPSMAWAFWLLFLLLLLYILFGGKRKQRIIPALKPNKNASVAFAETVGRLYLQKRDNRNIADKSITYFLEHLRNQYFLNTNHINNDFIETLSRKSSVPKEITEQLFQMISEIQRSAQIDDKKLLSLIQLIENFNKNKI